MPYCDAFPEVKYGWVEDMQEKEYPLMLDKEAERKVAWLQTNGLDLLALAETTLKYYPTSENKRVKIKEEVQGVQRYELAVKTWRLQYVVELNEVFIYDVYSGYEEATLKGEVESKWDDVPLHQNFKKRFS